ncbi:MAG: response regulator transcription factor [Actinobacteria bacterium]|nr:response regulator transcription factor [Actinomycetota bacterium]
MRVVIADDSTLLREGVARLLAEAGFEVVGLAGDVETLLRLVEVHRPDVAVVDIRMPPTHTDEGLRAAGRIRREHAGVGVLLLSQYVRVGYAVELLATGADGVGYLLKDRVSDLHEFAGAIRRVAAGGAALDPLVIGHLVGRRHRDTGPHGSPDALTGRERDVLHLMAEGRTNQAIAQRLQITERTVEKHSTAIFAKLNLAATPADHRRVLAVLAYLGAIT